mgnify:CR=1 FL=1
MEVTSKALCELNRKQSIVIMNTYYGTSIFLHFTNNYFFNIFKLYQFHLLLQMVFNTFLSFVQYGRN